MDESKPFLQKKLSFGSSTPKHNDPGTTVFIEENVQRLKLDSQNALMYSTYRPGNSIQYTMPTPPPPPPPPCFTRIALVYPEDEIWLRLQIREFLYRFGHVCQLEPRLISSLQNVQDNWRTRRLSATILWQALLIIGEFDMKKTNNDSDTSDNVSNNTSSQIKPEVRTLARKTVIAWGLELGVTKSSSSRATKEQLERIGELLSMKGMTAHRWQDVAELLALADFRNLPVPTTTDLEDEDASDDDDDDKEHMDTSDDDGGGGGDDDDDDDDDDGDDDLDSDSETDIAIKKFRALGRSPLSTKDELTLVQMLLDLLLLDGQLRRYMVDTLKEARTLEEEFRHVKRTTEAETSRYQSTRYHLMGRIDYYKRFVGHDQTLDLQQQLVALDQSHQQLLANLNESALKILVPLLRCSNRRLYHLVTPWDGNEYWLFNDLNSLQQHKEAAGGKELFWAHGVIVIGMPPNQQQDSNKRKWWHISGIANIHALEKWLANSLVIQAQQNNIDPASSFTIESEVYDFRYRLARRMDYLWLLEQTVYEPDYFTLGV